MRRPAGQGGRRGRGALRAALAALTLTLALTGAAGATEVQALAARGLTPNSHEGTVPETAVAATVNGEELPVSVLTGYIEGQRAVVGSQTDAAWEAFLADAGYTVDEYWAYLIEHYATQMLVAQRCEELGVVVSDLDVDARVAQMRAALGAEGEQGERLWQDYLALFGLTEDELRSQTAFYLRREKLFELEVPRPADGADAEAAGADAEAHDATDAEAGQVAQDADAAWEQACRVYLADLLEQADVVVLVEHQYDVEGQSHGVAGA